MRAGMGGEPYYYIVPFAGGPAGAHEVLKRLAELPDEFVMQHRVGDMPDCVELASRMWPE